MADEPTIILLVRLRDTDVASQTAAEISSLLAKRGVSTGTFDVRDPNDFVGARELETLLLLLRIFSVLGAALASFLVANTISAVISEELSQIGIIKALGGKRYHIAATYLIYSALIGLIGALVGLVQALLGAGSLALFLLASRAYNNRLRPSAPWRFYWLLVSGLPLRSAQL